jgi:2,4-dienoyl-CoA reductase-like NADH-dependent reductase (Old Yellow Enzyme family)
MKSETFKASVGSAYGEKLPKEIQFSYTVEKWYENYNELEQDKAVPSHDDVVDFVNLRNKNNERQKQQVITLSEHGYNKPDPNDPIVAAQTMIRNIEKMENMQAQQKQMMVAVLRQQIADEETKRKAAKDAAPATTE